MKQIILVSRIHQYNNEDEFSKYSTGEEAYICKGTDDIKLLILRGSAFHDGNNNSEIAEKILDQVIAASYLNPSEETILSFHFNDTNLAYALKDKFNGWNKIIFKDYSSGGNENENTLYTNILNLLGSALKGQQQNIVSTKIKELWNFFFGDPILEAKLELLHACLTPEEYKTVSWDVNNKITIARPESNFMGEIGRKGKTEFGELEKATAGPFGTEYLKALTELRNALLSDY